MFNKDELAGKWREVKGEVSKKWGEITDSDLETTKGNAESLVGLVQQKLGVKKEEAQQHLSDIASTWRAKGKSEVSKVADAANSKIDDAKDKLKN